jgi:hypothetical protein
MVAPDPAPEPEPVTRPVPADVAADGGACLQRLVRLGVVFKREKPIGSSAGCAVANPLSVTSLGSGVSLASTATLNCPTTEAVALWVRDVLVPSAKKHLRATPTRIVPGSTYACRPRNNQRGARLSEHAKANAFDVMSIEFANRPPLEIRSRGRDPDGVFQAAIRQQSCSYFTTVLGPGSDASHANHLHFDLAKRRGENRLCSMEAKQPLAGSDTRPPVAYWAPRAGTARNRIRFCSTRDRFTASSVSPRAAITAAMTSIPVPVTTVAPAEA